MGETTQGSATTSQPTASRLGLGTWLRQHPARWATVISAVLTAAALLYANQKPGDLWELPGKTYTELSSRTWDIPDGYIGRDYALMALTSITLALAAFAPVRESMWSAIKRWRRLSTGRQWRGVLAIVATFGYLIADVVETVLLDHLAPRIDSSQLAPDDTRAVLWMARCSNAKWLFLTAAVALVLSLWTRRVPPRPRAVRTTSERKKRSPR